MEDQSHIHYVIGLMSGSSLDGLDIAYCSFGDDGKWNFIKGVMCLFDAEIRYGLTHVRSLDLYEYKVLEQKFSTFCAKQVKSFIQSNNIQVDYIGSHGHTVMHHPDEGFSLQMGCGATMSALLELPVLCDFRQGDVSLGGQGAPLASLVDFYLFDQDEAQLNLGGIANVTVHIGGKTLAFDICPCNQILNLLAQSVGMDMDREGQLAKSGKINDELLSVLCSLDYFYQSTPKSLDNHWVKTIFWDRVAACDIPVEDKLATMTELVALQICNALKKYTTKATQSILVTGGGTHNSFLLQSIEKKMSTINFKISKPSNDIIDYKEAILMAYMAYWRMNNKNNILATATGASRDSQGGAIYQI